MSKFERIDGVNTQESIEGQELSTVIKITGKQLEFDFGQDPITPGEREKSYKPGDQYELIFPVSKEKTGDSIPLQKVKKEIGFNGNIEKVEKTNVTDPKQLSFHFPEGTDKKTPIENEDPNQDELYKFDPETENYWDR